jgi:hypothetical protein
VEENAHPEAVEEFVTPGSSKPENQAAPRIGRDARVASERKVMARVRAVSSQCVRPVFTQADHVVIRWKFRFDGLDGTTTQMEEIAGQRWEGERIAEKTFFHDPARRLPVKTP